MPILGAGLPIVDAPEDVEDPFDDSRTLAFQGLDGSNLLPFTGSEFIAQWGIEGLDVPPRTFVEGSVVGEEGSTLDEIKVGPRSWTIPLFVGSDSSHVGYLRNRARLRALFNHRGVDYRQADGTFDVVATSALGARRLRSAYADGLTGSWARETSASYREAVGLQGRSVQPLWLGEDWTTPKLTRPSLTAEFFDTFPPELNASRTLGAEISVTVAGDAGCWPRLVLQGPCPSVEIFGPGLYVRIPNGLADGEPCTITTDPRPGRRRADFGGVNDWTRIAPQRQFAKIAPGDQLFTLDLGEAGPTAFAYVQGTARYETPW